MVHIFAVFLSRAIFSPSAAGVCCGNPRPSQLCDPMNILLSVNPFDEAFLYGQCDIS